MCRGYADLSARPRIIKQANLQVPLYCTQSHSAGWKNGTWPSKMGFSHQKWDCTSPSPIHFVTPPGLWRYAGVELEVAQGGNFLPINDSRFQNTGWFVEQIRYSKLFCFV